MNSKDISTFNYVKKAIENMRRVCPSFLGERSLNREAIKLGGSPVKEHLEFFSIMNWWRLWGKKKSPFWLPCLKFLFYPKTVWLWRCFTGRWTPELCNFSNQAYCLSELTANGNSLLLQTAERVCNGNVLLSLLQNGCSPRQETQARKPVTKGKGGSDGHP